MQKKLDNDKYQQLNFGNEIINLITAIHEFRGKGELFSISNQEVLDKLVDNAKIQSVASSNRLEGIFTSEKRLRDIVQLKSTTPVSKRELVDGLLDISQITIERHLNNLLNSEKIRKIGKGRSTKYIINLSFV